MAFSVKAVVTLLPVFSHVEEHLGKVWIWQLLRLSGCISCCAGWLSVRSAPVLHFPGGHGLSVEGTREHGELGASFPSPGKKKKRKQLNLFPVFITNIDLGIREEQLQTFCGRNILGNLRSVHLARHGVSRGPARPRLIYRVSARRVAYSNRDFVALHFYAVHFQHCLRGLGFICKLNICQTLQSHTA